MWRAATEDDLKKSISDTEVEAYRAAAVEGSTDPVADLILRTVRLVRGYMRANRRIRLSADEALIPDTLIAPAMDYAAFDVVSRVPVDNTEDRRIRRQQAIAVFQAVAADHFYVESFEPEDEAASGSAARLVSHAPRRVTPEAVNGL